jgi:hypothetical protein
LTPDNSKFVNGAPYSLWHFDIIRCAGFFCAPLGKNRLSRFCLELELVASSRGTFARRLFLPPKNGAGSPSAKDTQHWIYARVILLCTYIAWAFSRKCTFLRTYIHVYWSTQADVPAKTNCVFVGSLPIVVLSTVDELFLSASFFKIHDVSYYCQLIV